MDTSLPYEKTNEITSSSCINKVELTDRYIILSNGDGTYVFDHHNHHPLFFYPINDTFDHENFSLYPESTLLIIKKNLVTIHDLNTKNVFNMRHNWNNAVIPPIQKRLFRTFLTEEDNTITVRDVSNCQERGCLPKLGDDQLIEQYNKNTFFIAKDSIVYAYDSTQWNGNKKDYLLRTYAASTIIKHLVYDSWSNRLVAGESNGKIKIWEMIRSSQTFNDTPIKNTQNTIMALAVKNGCLFTINKTTTPGNKTTTPGNKITAPVINDSIVAIDLASLERQQIHNNNALEQNEPTQCIASSHKNILFSQKNTISTIKQSKPRKNNESNTVNTITAIIKCEKSPTYITDAIGSSEENFPLIAAVYNDNTIAIYGHK